MNTVTPYPVRLPLQPKTTDVPPAPPAPAPPLPPGPLPPAEDRAKQIATLKGQIEALKQNNNQLELRKREGEMQATRLDSELFALKTEGDQLDIALGHAADNLRLTTDKLTALKQKLGTVPDAEKPAVQQEIDRLAPDIPKFTAEAEDLKRRKLDQQNRLQAKMAERAKLTADINGCVAAIQQNLGQLMRLEAALRQLESAPPPTPPPASAPGPKSPAGWWPTP